MHPLELIFLKYKDPLRNIWTPHRFKQVIKCPRQAMFICHAFLETLRSINFWRALVLTESGCKTLPEMAKK